MTPSARPERRTVLRLAGVPVRAQPMLAALTLLVMLSLVLRFTPSFSELTATAMALVGSVLFVGSLLAHELAHAIVAKGRGLDVEDITLHVFGGETRITGEVRRPGDELWLSVVGPWTSIVLGCAFGLVAYVSERSGVRPVAEVAGQLGWLNVLLGAFNLLPGAPLDGGRVLDAVVWRLTGRRATANVVTTTVGQGIGVLAVVVGIIVMLGTYGGFVSGLWLAAIGWLLFTGARNERAGFELRVRLHGRTVADLTRPPLRATTDARVDVVIDQVFRPGRADAVLVTHDLRPVGVLTATRLQALPPQRRAAVTAGALAEPLDHLAKLDSSDPAVTAFSPSDGQPVVVYDSHDEVIGILTPRNLEAAVRWLEAPSLQSPAADTALPGISGHRHRARAIGAWAGSWVIVIAALAVVPMPFFDLKPGPAIDVASTIVTDGPRHSMAGTLLMTSVTIDTPSALAVAAGWFTSHHELVSRAAFLPAGVPSEDYAAEQLLVFQNATRLAAAVGIKAAGGSVTILGDGAIVRAVERGGPADGLILPGDIITKVGGSPVHSVADLLHALASGVPNSGVRLGILRGGERVSVTVRPAPLGSLEVPTIGVSVEDALPTITLPFEVRSNRNDIGGPSAGLMTALTTYALTSGDDLTRGRVVAGTGTVDSAGDVGPVGGVAEKVIAASDAGASLFLVPTVDETVARAAAQGHHIRVMVVNTVASAISLLRTP